MEHLEYKNNIYRTAPRQLSFLVKKFPELIFYPKYISIVFKASSKAKREKYSDSDWAASSLGIFRALESVGVSIEIEGINNIKQLKTPCVFIGNHISVLETVILPGIIRPLCPVTFIIKQSLLNYPVFKHVMRSRDPIAVTRTDPRQDLKIVFKEGLERLNKGISIIVFPQTTRAEAFDPEHFSTIGVKLAHKAGLPVIPVALLTDSWSNGKLLKDFGKIDRSKKVHFCFGEPIMIEGRGNDEHQSIIRFITDKLREWKTP